MALRKITSISSTLNIEYHISERKGVFEGGVADLIGVQAGGDLPAQLVLVDRALERDYDSTIRRGFADAHIPVEIEYLPGGEESKTFETALYIVDLFNKYSVKRRSSPPIAIGGGVVLDVVGFAASMYRRGIPYIRVPTTLLGMIDVAVAAKTAVNFGGFRNRLGSYSPPPQTIIDTSFLQTLSRRHLSNGLGEIFKMALIKDAVLFGLLEDHAPALLDSHFDHPAACEVIRRAITGMAEELESNLWETDLERIVDYGHSFSPLIEMQSLPELLHGEAVALDCLFSAAISLTRGLLSEAQVDRITKVARACELPVHHELFTDAEMLQRSLQDTMVHRNGNQHLPILTDIGSCTFINDLTPQDIDIAIDGYVRHCTGMVVR